MSRYDLVVLGDCNPDVLVTGDDVTPSFGQQEKLVDGISLVIGGSAAITAVAAARLGLRVGRRPGPPHRRLAGLHRQHHPRRWLAQAARRPSAANAARTSSTCSALGGTTAPHG